MKKLKSLFIKYKEIISYLFWGVMTTLVSWGSYSLFVIIFDIIALSNILSWICAVLFAYVTNKLWVFESKSWKIKIIGPEILKFFGARLATGIVEMVGVPALVRLGIDQTIFGISGMVSKIIVSVVVVILNYILSKLLVFRRNNAEK